MGGGGYSFLQCCVSFYCIQRSEVEYPMLYSRFSLVIYFIHISVYRSIPISQFFLPDPPFPRLGVHTFVFYICVYFAVRFLFDKNVPGLVVMVVQLCEYTKNTSVVPFKRVNFMVCKLYLNKKKCIFNILVLREMQMKTTVIYYTHIRMAIIKKMENSKCW